MTKRKREELAWRAENRLKIYELAQTKLAKIDIAIDSIDPVPPRIAYDYEDGLEREDEPSLQELWANLLVNTTKPNGIIPQREFREILGRMESNDAILFDISWSDGRLDTLVTLRQRANFNRKMSDLVVMMFENLYKANGRFSHRAPSPDKLNSIRKLGWSKAIEFDQNINTFLNVVFDEIPKDSPLPLALDRLSSYGVITNNPVGMTMDDLGNPNFKLTALGKSFAEAVADPTNPIPLL